MNEKLLKIFLTFLFGYFKEALGLEVYISGDVPPTDIVEILFKDKDNLRKIYEDGLANMQTAPKKQWYYHLNSKTWSIKISEFAFPLLFMGILLEDWKFVNEYNPYQENV